MLHVSQDCVELYSVATSVTLSGWIACRAAIALTEDIRCSALSVRLQ